MPPVLRHTITDVFFDLDHTLWDFEKNSKLAFQKLFQDFDIKIPLEEFLKYYEPINFKYWKLYREDQISKENMRHRRLTDTFAQLNHEFPPQLIGTLAEKYIDYLPLNNHLLPGAVEILEHLKPRYRLHIITNGFEEVQNRKLIHSGIEHYFDTITNSERVGVKKPNPEIFRYALNLAQTTPRQSIMIGDNLEADIMGAEALGFHTIHFATQQPAPANRLTLSCLTHIKNFL